MPDLGIGKRMKRAIIGEVERMLGTAVERAVPLGVGFGLTGLRVWLADGRQAAVKAGRNAPARTLEIEGYMLGELRRLSSLPVPEVYYSAPGLLIMQWIDNDGGGIGAKAEREAARLLAALHAQGFPYFGYERDTLIGPLPQPNPPAHRWVPFFRDHRLLHMARVAREAGQLPGEVFARIARFAEQIDRYLEEPAHASLIHGDLWTGNVLVRGGRIAGFVDPAIYCAHPEIELAFTTMFGTFGAAFFAEYEALRPLAPGFHELRRDIYNLYPTLVHVRLFGRSYLDRLDCTLRRLGF